MKRLFAFYCMFVLAGLSRTSSSAQVINTLAGMGPVSGMGSYGGDGGPAVLARLNRPAYLALDTLGNVYFSDYENWRVRKVNAAGIITTICGNGIHANTGDGGLASAASLTNPLGIVIDKFGNMYIVVPDYGGYVIRRIDAAGIITAFAGTGVLGYSGDGGPASAAMLSSPVCLATDDTGNLYVSENSGVRKINTAGIITTIAGTPGVIGYSGDGGPATAAVFNVVTGIKLDKKGNLYIVDEVNYRVRKVDRTGIVTTIAGTGVAGYSGDGGPATAAQISECSGLGIDTSGNVYLPTGNTGDSNNVVRKVDTAGIITTIVGTSAFGYGGDGGPPTAAELANPHDVAVSPNGIIYISEEWGQRIRVISFNLYFNAGKYQAATLCAGNALALDTMLAANDSNVGMPEYWMPLAGPYHGTALATYSATTTGGTVYPSGLSYTPAPGFSGVDTLVVRITDAAVSDTTTIYLNVVPRPVTGPITGPDTLCRGDSVLLSDTTAGGSWSASNGNVTVSAGMVRGVSAGTDTLSYVVMNMCGPDTVSHLLTVKLCPSSVSVLNPVKSKINIYPNPAAGAFTFSLPEPYDEAMKIIITNPLGEKVQQLSAMTNSPGEIQISGPPGIYFINAVTAHGIFNEKIVLSKQ